MVVRRAVSDSPLCDEPTYSDFGTLEDAGAERVMRLEYPRTSRVADMTLLTIRIRSTLVWRMAHGHRQMVRLLDERGCVLGIRLLHRGDDSLSQVVDSIR